MNDKIYTLKFKGFNDSFSSRSTLSTTLDRIRESLVP